MKKLVQVVYRLEHVRDGRGPYSSHAWQIPYMDAYADATHPMPTQDGIDAKGYYSLCAFTSVGQMLDWFQPKQLHEILSHGFVVRKYSVHDDNLQIGGYQVVIRKSYARKLGVWDATGIY